MKHSLAKIMIFIIVSAAYMRPVDADNEEILSAAELLQHCETGSLPGAPNQYCMRYVFGLVQTVLTLQQADQSAPIFCINPQVTGLEEATDNVIVYLRSQASRANEEAQILVIEALNKNYPCKPGIDSI